MRTAFRVWAAEKITASWAACEAALAHRGGNVVEQAYARTDWYAERVGLMSHGQISYSRRPRPSIQRRTEAGSSNPSCFFCVPLRSFQRRSGARRPSSENPMRTDSGRGPLSGLFALFNQAAFLHGVDSYLVAIGFVLELSSNCVESQDE